MNKLSAREREAVFLAAKKTHSWCPSRCFVLQSSAGPVLSFRVRRDTQSFTAPMPHKATCPALCLFTHVRGRQILLSPSCHTVQSALRTIKPQLVVQDQLSSEAPATDALDTSPGSFSAPRRVLVSMSPISLVATDSEHNLFLNGRSCVSDVQNESPGPPFSGVCRSVLARLSRLWNFAWTCASLRSMNVAPSSEQTSSGPRGMSS